MPSLRFLSVATLVFPLMFAASVAMLAAAIAPPPRLIEVSTADALASALARARPGDEIILRDGTYRGTFTLADSGTAARPITIRAQNPRRVVFDRALFNLDGSHAVLIDFVFERSQVSIGGDHNRVAHNIFRFSDDRPRGADSAVRTTGGASHNRIHHNELTSWGTYGFRVRQPNERTTGNRIDHNYIHDYSNVRSSNEPEVFQINSNNTVSNLNVGTIIEYNLVERVRITGELLSLKTSGNTVRCNTFVDIQGTVQGRHGRNNAFINNTIINGSGLRAYGDGHRLIGNHLVGTDLIIPAGDVTQDALQKPDGTGGHPAARDQLVAANLVEGGGRVLVGKGLRSTYAIPARNTTLAGNTGPLVTEGSELKHTGTRMVATYDGDPGKPVRMTREQVGPGAPDPLLPAGGRIQPGTTGWREDFSNGMADWWTEGGERVRVENGRLHVSADAPGVAGGTVATVWSRKPLPPNFELEVDAHVMSSTIDVNNINLFFCYADPSGRPLEETRESRRTAAYGLYHVLNGYIVTFLNEGGKARIRLRRNPGFVMLEERYEGECRAGVTYRLKVRKQNGEIVFSVDGRELARATDPHPWQGGLLGLRTFRTHLWWDNVRVRALDAAQD